MYKTGVNLHKNDFLERKMRIEEVRPKIRFAERLEYTASRPLSKTYDCRLICVTDGGGQISVGDKRYEIEKGLLVMFTGGVAYSFSPSPAFTAYAVDFDLDGGYDTESGFLPPVPSRLFDKSALHRVPTFEDSGLFSSAFVTVANRGVVERVREVTEAFCSKGRFRKVRAELMLTELFLTLEDSAAGASKAAGCAAFVTEYIDAHYLEDLTNATLARLVGHDACYLGRVVKLHTGYTIHRLLIKKRVEAGIKLLLTTDLTLDAVAERTGFCSAAHFSKSTKAVTGNNPSTYRKN